VNWLLREGNAEQSPRVVLRVNNVYGIFPRRRIGLGHRLAARHLARE